MYNINMRTATSPCPTQPSLAPSTTVASRVSVDGIGWGKKSVFRTTGQVDINPMADQHLGTAVPRVWTNQEAALPRGVPR
jgi:hypothetical protein